MPVLNKNGIVENAFIADIILENSADIEAAFGLHHNAQLIGILFPSHSDGRGFSIAKTLRRLGFNGILRAIGPVIPDQFANLIASGFDEIEILSEQYERQKWQDWENALIAYSNSYQRQNGEKLSILNARRANHGNS